MDPGKKSLSSIHFRLSTSFRPSAERRLTSRLQRRLIIEAHRIARMRVDEEDKQIAYHIIGTPRTGEREIYTRHSPADDHAEVHFLLLNDLSNRTPTYSSRSLLSSLPPHVYFWLLASQITCWKDNQGTPAPKHKTRRHQNLSSRLHHLHSSTRQPITNRKILTPAYLGNGALYTNKLEYEGARIAYTSLYQPRFFIVICPCFSSLSAAISVCGCFFVVPCCAGLPCAIGYRLRVSLTELLYCCIV